MFSFGTRHDQAGSNSSPGPGQYSPERSGKSVLRSSPAYSICGRWKEGANSQVPDPASYSLLPMLGPKAVVTPAAPTYSLCGRSKNGSFHEDLKKTPGPAAYKVVDPCIYRQKPPQFSMTGRNFTPDDTTKTPGTGAHSLSG